VAGAALAVVLLEVLPRAGVVDPRYLPPVSEILAGLGEWARTEEFWTALRDTLVTWGLGLGIALAAGIGLGLLIGNVRWLRLVTASTIEFLRPIPSVALIPLAVVLFGSSIRSTLLLVVYATLWQVLVQVIAGAQDVDPVARETAISFRFGRVRQLRTVVWPSALPYTMTGVRLGASVALILTVTGELIIGSPGIGKLLAIAQSSGAVDLMYALVLVTGLLGVAVNLAARAVERVVLRWHPSVRGEVAA
jgi:ABC-type nitrate/sulfonate/bicarbonate transport system permease component